VKDSQKSVTISNVLHYTKVIVNEEGSEAAAATGQCPQYYTNCLSYTVKRCIMALWANGAIVFILGLSDKGFLPMDG